MDFNHLTGFEWDAGNLKKVSERVPVEIVEESFFLNPLVKKDEIHSLLNEQRYLLICLDLERPVFLSFTVRKEKIRVISARYMHQREVKKYEKAN